MAQPTFTPISGTSIQTPTQDPANLQRVAQQLKEAVEIGQRLRGNVGDSFVRVSELQSALGVRVTNNTIQPPSSTSSSGSTTITVQDSITGAGTVASPLQLVNDVALPGNNMVYGTNGSGTRGWQTASGGSSGSNAFNVTPDTHTSTPTGIGVGPNDEFEYGTSIDTTGARYTGATPWTVVSSNMTITSQLGALTAVPATAATATFLALQPIASGSSWAYIMKVLSPSIGGYGSLALTLYNSANNNALTVFTYAQTSVYLQRDTVNPTTGLLTVVLNVTNLSVSYPAPIYLKVSFDGANVHCSYSYNGLGWVALATEPLSSFISAVSHVGIAFNNDTPYAVADTAGFVDFFRRIA